MPTGPIRPRRFHRSTGSAVPADIVPAGVNRYRVAPILTMSRSSTPVSRPGCATAEWAPRPQSLFMERQLALPVVSHRMIGRRR